jgi:hypothetical protein
MLSRWFPRDQATYVSANELAIRAAPAAEASVTRIEMTFVPVSADAVTRLSRASAVVLRPRASITCSATLEDRITSI